MHNKKLWKGKILTAAFSADPEISLDSLRCLSHDVYHMPQHKALENYKTFENLFYGGQEKGSRHDD